MMKIQTTWEDLKTMPWQAVFRCMEEYRQTHPGHAVGYDTQHYHDHYREYMRENWGIDHGTESIQIVDQKKYTMFLLRFS